MMKKAKYFLALCVVMLLAAFTMACTGGKTIENIIDGTIDEGGFAGTTVTEQIPLQTDSFVTVDGELDEDCWQNKKWFSFNYNGVEVNATTVFSELGFYVGFRIGDKNVYANINRMVWMGASIEMYVDRGDATQRTSQTFQYRLSALNVVELLNGKANPEDNWTFKYLPIYGLAKVDGVLNSGDTNGLNAEIFVRWDALGYDYTAEGFTRPQSVKIMPVYNQSTGPELTSPRAYWCNNGGDINSPMQYWLFDENGFADGDAANAVIGDGEKIGRAKSYGWDVSKEPAGEVSSKTAGDQTVYFKDIYSEQYIATALMQYNEALPFWSGGNYNPDPYPKAGIVMAAEQTVHAFVLDYSAQSAASAATFKGMFFKKGNPDPRDNYWQLFDAMPLNLNPAEPVRLTTVKVGKYLLAFAGGKDAPKYGGTLVGMQEMPTVSGAASPGFYTLGCKATFTDYAATDDIDAVKSKISGVLSLLEIDNKVGGQITADASGYRSGDTAVLSVRTTNNYRLTSLKVNGAEKIADLADGTLTLAMTADVMRVEPTYEYMTENRFTVTGKIAFSEGAPSFGGTEIVIIRSDNAITAYYTPDGEGNYEAYLPAGSYKAVVRLFGIFKTSVDFTVAAADVTLPDISIKGNLEFADNAGITYNSDGSAVISNGNNSNKTFKGATLTNQDFYVKTSLRRVDGIYVENGTWSTGGILVNTNGKNFRFYIMKEGSGIVLYANILEKYNATKELRYAYAYAGTGAPIDILFIYKNDQIELVLNGEKHITLTSEQLGADFADLFSATNPKTPGLCVIDSPSNKGIKFDKFDFGVGADSTLAAIGTVSTPVTVTAGEGGAITGPDYIFVGDTVQFGVTATGDNNILTLTVNGVDRLADISGGKISVSYIGTPIVIEATFEAVVKYDVTGTIGTAGMPEGMFGANGYGELNVATGATTGVVTGTGAQRSFSIRLADGTHKLVVSSSNFTDITQTVTVSGGAVQTGQLNFLYAKSSNPNVAYNDDGSLGFGGDNEVRLLANAVTASAGANADKSFAITTELKRTDGNFTTPGGWWTGGVAVKVGEDVYRVFVMAEASGAFVYFGSQTDGFPHKEFRTGYKGYTAGTGAPLKLTVALVESENVLHVMLNGAFHLAIGIDDVEHAAHKAFFTAPNTTARTLGVVNCAAPAMTFSKNQFSLGAAGAAAAIDAMKAEVTVNTPDNGTVTVTPASVYKGDRVVVTLTPDADYEVETFTVDGGDRKAELAANKYTIEGIQGAVELYVSFAYNPVKYTVTGTYSYAQGLYAEGDVVTVACGAATGTVDGDNKTFTIELGAGSQTVILSGTRYKSVTKVQNVQQDGAIGNLEFTTVKFTDDSGVTYADDSFTVDDKLLKKELAGSTLSGNFEVNYSLERKDGYFYGEGWNTGGLGIKVGSEWFRIFIQNEGDKIIVVLNNDTNWFVDEHRFRYTACSGAPMTLSVAVFNDSLYLYLDGYMKYAIAKADCAPQVQAIFTAGEKSLGLVTVDQPMKFSGVSWSPLTALPAKYTANDNTSGLTFTDTAGMGFGANGDFVLESGNYKGLTDGTNPISYAGSFEMTVKLQRSDNDFGAWGTWNTGGIGLKAGGDVFYIYVMKENATDDVVYVRNITKDKTAEYRQGGAVSGTGAPTTLKLTYADGAFSLLINDTLTYTLRTDNAKDNAGAAYTVDADIQTLFAAGAKEIGICAVSKSILFDSSAITHKALA